MTDKAFNVFQFRRQGTSEEEITQGLANIKRQKSQTALASLYSDADRRDAEGKLDWWAVCLVGVRDPIPERIGSNSTRSPVKVVVCRDPTTAAKRADYEQPIHPLETLRYVWVLTEVRGKRIKAALDILILGDDAQLVELRFAWRDMPEWERKWDELLQQAVLDVYEGELAKGLARKGEMIETFDEEGKARLIDHVLDKKYGRSR